MLSDALNGCLFNIPLFISSQINIRTSWQFFILNRESWIGKAVPVVPLTIKQYIDVITYIYDNGLNIDHLKKLIENIHNKTFEYVAFKEWDEYNKLNIKISAVTDGIPTLRSVFIDAVDGQIVNKYSHLGYIALKGTGVNRKGQQIQLNTDKIEGNFYFRDTTRNIEIYDGTGIAIYNTDKLPGVLMNDAKTKCTFLLQLHIVQVLQ